MISIIVAFLVSALLCYWLKSAQISAYFRDEPNERSLHEIPVPRTGSMAIIAGIIFGWGITAPFDPAICWISGAFLAVALVSIIDDLRGLSPLARILVHLIATVVLVEGLIGEWGWMALFFVLAVIWMINLYNFMDGMDGFAGGMALIGFTFLATAGYLSGHEAFAVYAMAVGASAAGFLLFNFPPAKLFMGDAGSTALGALAAALSLWGVHDGIFELWFPLLVFSPFVVDATVTLLRRLLRGEKVWQAHREHYYQRLALAGWGHRRTVMAEYVLMLATGSSAVALLHWEQAAPYGLAAWTVIYVLLAYRSERFFSSGISQAE